MRPSHKEKMTYSSGIFKNNLRHPVYIFVRVVCIRSHPNKVMYELAWMSTICSKYIEILGKI
jgi:hypothetical protein